MILLEHEQLAQIDAESVLSPSPLAQAVAVADLMVFSSSDQPVSQTHQWASVSGADSVEVNRGSVTFGSSSREKALSGLSFSKEGQHHVVNFGRLVQLGSLSLQGFTYTPLGGTEAVPFSPSSSDRLVISIPNEQTQWLPLYAQPHLSSSSMPVQYAGVSVSIRSNLLTIAFPIDMPAVRKLRLSVMRNFPGDGEQLMHSEIGDGSARIINLPVDLELSNITAQQSLFKHPGLFLKSLSNIPFDLTNPVQAAFDQQLLSGEDLSFEYQLKTANQSAFQYAITQPRGALIRHFTGISQTTLEGRSQMLELDLTAGVLDQQAPTSARAGLTVTYQGLRVLERYDDPVPDSFGDVAGRVVTEDSVQRVLLDPQIRDYPIDRIGIIGRAPQGCELSLSILPASGEQVPLVLGPALGDPGVAPVAASNDIQLTWVPLPKAISHAGKLVLQLRANGGRFLWARNAASKPAIKVVVQDPDPGQRPININNRLLTRLSKRELHLPSISIIPSLFSQALPRLSSKLFVSVEVSDLSLRYAR